MPPSLAYPNTSANTPRAVPPPAAPFGSAAIRHTLSSALLRSASRSTAGRRFAPWLAPPSRLASLLITNQIQEYCCQINRHTHSSFSKLFLTGSLHKKTT